MSTTPPAPPPGPPSAPPPSPPSAPPPGAAPGPAPARKSGGGTNIWLVLFIVVGVLFVGALIFAIISFTGKSSAEDDKDKAQKELASTKKELKGTQGELGTQKGAGQILGDLVRTGAKSADDLKACTDSARAVQNQAIDVLNARQAGTDVNPQIDGLNAAIDQNESVCNASGDSYQQFVDALDKVRNR
jgi:flagellar basal body-associated protein FliL